MPAALPAAAEAALGILKQLRVMRGETLLVLGAAGSVGMIAMQPPRFFALLRRRVAQARLSQPKS
jgi:NADPH-dependent curcumin reductase CurA